MKIKYIKLILSSICLIIILLINVCFIKDKNNKEVVINKKITCLNYNKIIKNLKNKYNNDDIVGVLKIEDKLEVPLVQSKDNDYYLNHSIYKKESNLGATFIDYRIDINSSRKILIYGHSAIKNDTPFNILENYYEKEYYENHKYISLTTNKEEKIYEIFSVYVETSNFSYMNINFIDDEDYYKHISSLKDKSLYDTGIKLKENDEILILQTCSNNKNYKNQDKKYLLIISRRID